MNFWIVNALLDFLMCVLFAGVVIPQILLIASKNKLYDVPDERKIHTLKVPRLGGIAFKPVVFFSTAFLFGMNLIMGNSEILTAISTEGTELIFRFY